jgi:hypothetical protein
MPAIDTTGAISIGKTNLQRVSAEASAISKFIDGTRAAKLSI